MNTDALCVALDAALRTLWAQPRASRPSPAQAQGAAGLASGLPADGGSGGDSGGGASALRIAQLSPAQRREAGALMRVNHVGEVCAQALYTGQMLATRSPALHSQLAHACREETDHLAWTAERLQALDARPSHLNPLWYAGAFAIGFAAGRLGGDAVSLGFVAETERQVEAHLRSHLDRLPAADTASRAVVAQMMADEAAHADMAQASGAAALPAPVAALMRGAARVMTTVAHRV